jgi:hypothetical protein
MQLKKISVQRHSSFAKQIWEKADFAKIRTDYTV